MNGANTRQKKDNRENHKSNEDIFSPPQKTQEIPAAIKNTTIINPENNIILSCFSFNCSNWL